MFSKILFAIFIFSIIFLLLNFSLAQNFFKIQERIEKILRKKPVSLKGSRFKVFGINETKVIRIERGRKVLTNLVREKEGIIFITNSRFKIYE